MTPEQILINYIKRELCIHNAFKENPQLVGCKACTIISDYNEAKAKELAEIERLEAEIEKCKNMIACTWSFATDAYEALSYWNTDKACWDHKVDPQAVLLAKLKLSKITKSLEISTELELERLAHERGDYIAPGMMAGFGDFAPSKAIEEKAE